MKQLCEHERAVVSFVKCNLINTVILYFPHLPPTTKSFGLVSSTPKSFQSFCTVKGFRKGAQMSEGRHRAQLV